MATARLSAHSIPAGWAGWAGWAGLAGLAGRAGRSRLGVRVESNPRSGHQLEGARGWHAKVHLNMLSRPSSRTSWLIICRPLAPMTLSPGSDALIEGGLEAGGRGVRVSARVWCDMREARRQAG